MSKRADRAEEAQQTFRQFAWNLAGTLASAKAGTLRTPAARPRPQSKRA
jgi:hypothetical protein